MTSLNKTEEEQMLAFDNWSRDSDRLTAFNHFSTWQAAIAHANSKHSTILQDYDRLAKLAEEHATEITRLQNKLMTANAAIEMKDEELKDAIECLHDVATGQGGWAWEEVISQAQDARNATPQQVSEWEEKKLEQLRQQVAIANAALLECDAKHPDYSECCQSLVNALSNTQATAEAFVAECEQRGAVKALTAENVMCYIIATLEEAKQRGGMFPQTSDAQRSDSDAGHQTMDLIRWYGERGYPQPAQIQHWIELRAHNRATSKKW